MKKYIKKTIIILGLITFFIGGWYILAKHQIEYTIKGRCVEKRMFYDARCNETTYKVLLKMEDGTAEEVDADVGDYTSYDTGKTYSYTRYKMIW